MLTPQPLLKWMGEMKERFVVNAAKITTTETYITNVPDVDVALYPWYEQMDVATNQTESQHKHEWDEICQSR